MSEETATRPLHRYKNEFRWRVSTSEAARAEGWFERSFGSKKAALTYQKRVKEAFPTERCTLNDTGRYYDFHGHIYERRE